MKVQTKLIQLFDAADPFKMECGETLPEVRAAYETYGTLNEAGDNAVLICHALTGDAHAAGEGVFPAELLKEIPFYSAMKEGQPGWWDAAIGPGKAFDTDRFFVISSNILGSCYGTTGPVSINPETGRQYGPDFPPVTVRDIVHVQRRLLQELGVKKLVTISGGSLGGMQALEWAVLYPELVSSIIPIAASAQHSAWAVAFNHLTRQAVMNDPAWNGGCYTKQPENGMALARQIGMLSYRTDISFQARFGRGLQNPQSSDNGRADMFRVESYLNYQGDKLVKRFDANTLLTITNALDGHDLARGRGSLERAFALIKAPALCIGINSDILYPAQEQREIAAGISRARYAEIKSSDGHDGFLIEFEQLQKYVQKFLDEI